MVMKPAWLEGLIAETFFTHCGTHENRRKNEKNVFCLDCLRSICPHCVTSHRSHPLIQVRRYVYNDVVRLDDLEKLIDCSYIQPYTINSAKVIFLNPRPQTRACKDSANICYNCDRILQEKYHFCSLSCKVDHVVLQGGDLSSILYRFDESDFEFSQFEGLQMDGSDITEEDDITPNSILEDHPLGFMNSSCSNNNSRNNSSGISQDSSVGLVKKKKGNGFFPGNVFPLAGERELLKEHHFLRN